MAAQFIIPDSIEPYLGYKALIMRSGHLVSPSYEQIWPKNRPLRADCMVKQRRQTKFTWKLVQVPEGWDNPDDLFWVPSRFLRQGASTHFDWPQEPAPPGFTFVPVEERHELKNCRCGIYAVDTPQQCSSYLAGGLNLWRSGTNEYQYTTAPERLLVLVAVWGQVIKADRGVRGSLAYPQRMFAAAQQAEVAIPIAEDYGIPIEVVSFYE